MTGRLNAIRAFVNCSIPDAGLPADLSLDEVRTVLDLDDEPLGSEPLGLANREAQRWPADSGRYEGGAFVYSMDDHVLLVAGIDPLDETHEPLESDEAALHALGQPELVLDAALGGLMLTGAERVWSSRGLAVRTNPANDLLLAVLLFAPVDSDGYLAQIRPDAGPRRWLGVPQ